MQARLWDGDPRVAGVEVSALDYPTYDVDTSEDEYPDATDGFNKYYIGPWVTYQAESNWGDVTHFSLGVSGGLDWVFELTAPVTMNTGMYLAVRLPNLVWSSGSAMVGPSEEIRQNLFSSMFGNEFVVPHTLSPANWIFALYIGDPLVAGVEVSEPDYYRVTLSNGTVWGAAADPYMIALDTFLLEFPPCQTDWGIVTHMGMINGDTDQLEHVVELDDPLNLVAGNLVRWLPGDLIATLGGPV
jgi:hypothetical protein